MLTWHIRDVSAGLLSCHVSQAEQYFLKERNRLPLFALGHAMMAFMRAMMTFGRVEVEEAEARLKHTLVQYNTVGLAVSAPCCTYFGRP